MAVNSNTTIIRSTQNGIQSDLHREKSVEWFPCQPAIAHTNLFTLRAGIHTLWNLIPFVMNKFADIKKSNEAGPRTNSSYRSKVLPLVAMKT